MLAGVRKPVVAAIHGYCLGGGLKIALACDIRIASQDAQFALPELGLGIIPGAGGTQRLSRAVGVATALRLTLTGERIDAAEAMRVGLVSEVVPADRLAERAMELAGKQLIWSQMFRPWGTYPIACTLGSRANSFGKVGATAMADRQPRIVWS